MRKKMNMKKQVTKAISLAMGLAVAMPMTTNFTYGNNEHIPTDTMEQTNVPEPIKVITADDLRQIAAETLTGEAVEENVISEEAIKPTIGYTVDSELVLKNPFGSKELQENMKEYEEWATFSEMDKEKYGYIKPKWEKGLTMSYWINVPADLDKQEYHSSGALRWELENEEYYQVDDYAKYLTNLRYHKEIEGYSDVSGVAAKLEESKVLHGSEHYFKYVQTEGVDEDGAPLPMLHQETDNISGPVYDYRFINYESKDYAPYFAYNPNYRQGYIYTADGECQLLYEKEKYKGYNTLYLSEEKIRDKFEVPETEIITEGSVFIDNETTHRYSTGSLVRVAECDGEFQVDTDNSAYFVGDDGTGIQQNVNDSQTYGKVMWMQGKNEFSINSWQASQQENELGGGTYDSAKKKALSPVTSMNASGEAVAYGNCNEWHQVTITLQNDWLNFYVDGVCVDVLDTYSTMGHDYINTNINSSGTSFNKGMAMRWITNAGEYMVRDLPHGNFVARLFMDWLTDEDATLHIGGVGKNAAKYNLADNAMEFNIDEMRFYDQLLTEEQITEAYEEQEGRLLSGKSVINEGVYLGAVNEGNKVALADATKILRYALLLEEPTDDRQRFLADVDESGTIELADATKALRMALLLDEWKEVEYLAK